MIEPPAMLAILGATPLGIEAALYGRFLGYKVALLDEGEALADLRQRGTEPLGGPFRDHCSPLGLAALAAQDPQYQPPDLEAQLTMGEWAERYLAPLLASDLVAESLREGTQIVSIERNAVADDDADPDDEPATAWRLALRGNRGESSLEAAALIDASLVPPAIDPEVLAFLPLARLASGTPRSFAAGLSEIAALFGRISGRAELNLYARFGM